MQQCRWSEYSKNVPIFHRVVVAEHLNHFCSDISGHNLVFRCIKDGQIHQRDSCSKEYYVVIPTSQKK